MKNDYICNIKYNIMNQNLINIFIDTELTSRKLKSTIETEKCNCSVFEPKEGNSNIKITVSPLDTISEALNHKEKVCILNMASPKRAGGGVKNGARAQEECLFRSTNLCVSVVQDFYPLHYDEFLYTKDALIIKDVYYNVIEPKLIDCITIAAPNLRGSQYTQEDYVDTLDLKITGMIEAANRNSCETLILGAWGCGVFCNNPYTIAEYFKKNITKYKYNNLKEIIFAIINDHNSVDDNYNIFKKHFNQ